MREVTVDGPDERHLAVLVAGADRGPLIIAHHGTPGCADLPAAAVASATGRGLRLASVTRPGYAGSDRDRGRTVADVATDTAAVADALQARHFLTWGVSGGGPHALACAARLPDRVSAVAVLAGVAPFDAEGLDFLAGMGQDNHDEFGAAAAGEAVLRQYLEPQRAELVAAAPEQLARQLATLLPPVDAAVLAGTDGPAVARSIAGGLIDSVDGWVDDDLAFVRHWGFDPADVSCPALLLQGGEDLMVPLAHVRWLGERMPAPAQVRLLPGEGHLSLMSVIDDVQAWLREQGTI